MAAESRAISALLFDSSLWPWRPVVRPFAATAFASPAEADLCRLAASLSAEQEALAANAEAARLRIAELTTAATPDSCEASALAALSAQVDAAQATKQAILETEAVAVDAALEALQNELVAVRETSAETSETPAAIDSLPRVEALFQRLRSLPCAPLEPSIMRIIDTSSVGATPVYRLFAPRGPMEADLRLLPPFPGRVKLDTPLHLSCVLSDDYEPLSVSPEELGVLAGVLSTHLSVEIEIIRVSTLGGTTTVVSSPRDVAALPHDDVPAAESATVSSPMVAVPPIRAGHAAGAASSGPLASSRPTRTAAPPPMPAVSSSAVGAPAPSRAAVAAFAKSRRSAARPPRLPATASSRAGPDVALQAGPSPATTLSTASLPAVLLSSAASQPSDASPPAAVLLDAYQPAAAAPAQLSSSPLTNFSSLMPLMPRHMAISVQCSPVPIADRSSASDVPAPAARRFDLACVFPVPLHVGDIIRVLRVCLGGKAVPTASLPAIISVSASLGLLAPQSINFAVQVDVDDAVTPCVTSTGVLYAPSHHATTIGRREADDRVFLRDMCTVYSSVGEIVSEIPWRVVGVKDAPCDNTLVCAYDDISRLLYVVDGCRSPNSRVLAIDPAAPSLKWATVAGRLSCCHGLAVCRTKGVLLATSFQDSKLQLYRLRDGCRVTLLDDPPRMRNPTVIAWDATSGRVNVAHTTMTNQHAVTSLRWESSSHLRSTASSLVVDAEVTAWPDDADFLHMGGFFGRGYAVMSLAVVPPTHPGAASHLVVGRGNMLWIHSLPGLARVASYTLPEGEVVLGLAGDPSGGALVVVVHLTAALHPALVNQRGVLRRPMPAYHRSARRALRVLPWPLCAADEGSGDLVARVAAAAAPDAEAAPE